MPVLINRRGSRLHRSKIASHRLCGRLAGVFDRVLPAIRGTAEFGVVAGILWFAATVPGIEAQAQSVLPNGGHVTAGNATIGTPAGNSLSITQTSPRAVIDWKGFSIGQPNTVNFAQPNSAAAVLNRVTGNTPSTIAGQLNANGQVYLVNPNGIAITRSGTVNVGGGFVASTLGITNRDFMSGNLAFTGNGASAPVSNAGTITVGSGGYAALLGGTAANSGTVNVPLGKVGVGSGEQATLDLNGDGFMQVAAPTGAKTAQGQPLVSNSGAINAPGGSVELKAATVATAIRDAVNMSGVVSANSVSGHNGAITLGGGPGGNVNVSGTINVAGTQSGQTGGTAIVSGRTVNLTGTARIDTRGAAGGGTVKIGGGAHGQDPLVQNALVANISAGAVIDASATDNGNGGNVTMWSDTTTTFNGTVYAQGGPNGGNGGTIETSGGQLTIGPSAAVGAVGAVGNPGTWLLDPVTLTIDTTTASAISGALQDGFNVSLMTSANGYAYSGIEVVPPTDIAGSGNIYVDAPISWNNSPTLTLSAYNNIIVNSPITLNFHGGLTLISNNMGANNNATITVNAPIVLAAPAGGFLDFETPGNPLGLIFTMGQGSAQFTGGAASGANLVINGTTYTLLYDMAGLQEVDGSGNYALAQPFSSGMLQVSSPIVNLSGAFNGLGNTITDFRLSDGSGEAGLFGTNSGSISNLGLIGGTVTSPVGNAGALVGNNTSFGTITNVYATTAVSGPTAGGLVGLNAGSIANSYATGAVMAGPSGNAGGLVAVNSGGTIGNVYATGAVSDGNSNGGLVGVNQNSGSVSQAYATGALSIGSGSFLGGLIGSNDATSIVSSAYWNTSTSGTGIGIGSNSNPTGASAGGLTTAQLTGALPSGFSAAVWDNVDNQTSPYLVSNPGPVFLGTDASATSAGYNLIFTPIQLQAINNSLSGDFLLANDIDMATALPFMPIGATSPFTGTFNGLGNIIANLTVNDAIDSNVGLFGQVGAAGKISNVGLIGGSVTASQPAANIGALVGANSGSLVDVYATISVSDVNSNGGNNIGGLVGSNTGSINMSYAAGAVQGSTADFVGGLVGQNQPNGSIQDSYATGSVTGNSSTAVGGLVGQNTEASISNTYATGVVSNASDTPSLGGLVGFNVFGMITNGYWDTTTDNNAGSGVNINGTITGGGGIATGDLLAALPAGFSPTVWGNANNQTTPYLLNNAGPVYVGSDPFLSSGVSTAVQLQRINDDLNGTYALLNSIDLTNAFLRIGGDTTGFTGIFNGLGNVFENPTIEDTTHINVGLFAQLGAGGTIKNVGVVGGSVSDAPPPSSASTPYVGALAGANFGTITNAYASAAVGDGGSAGGLVGYNAPGGTISNSYATGAVNAPSSQDAGGLVGYNSGTILYSYATGSVTGGSASHVGGLVGQNFGGTVNFTYAAGAVGPAGAALGGLVGINDSTGSITNSYFNQDRAGTGVAGVASDGNSGNTSVTGLMGADAFKSASYVGFNFTNDPAAGTGNNWVMINALGCVTTSGCATAATLYGTMPMLASEYSTTIENAHQLQLVAMDLHTNYTVARNIDATGTGSSTSGNTGNDVWSSNGFIPLGNVAGAGEFDRTFDGGGFAIVNLTIRADATTDFNNSQYVGLFGSLGPGTVEDLALVGGSVSGNLFGNGTYLGSLVGRNNGGTILNVYSTAAASGNDYTGGLVGCNCAGTITNAYSTGPVTAGDLSVGGLVGTSVGGVTNGYWDTETSGVPTSADGTPETTFFLQNTSLTALGFPSTVWSTVLGLTYPYFSAQIGGGTPQVLSGIVYSSTNIGTHAGAGVAVTALSDAGLTASANTGANGYYYNLLQPASVAAGDSVLIYASGTVNGAAFLDQVTPSASSPISAPVFANTLTVTTPAAEYSTAASSLGDIMASSDAAAILVGGLANQTITASNTSGFAIDQEIQATGIVTLNAAGAVAESGGGLVQASTLTGSSVGGLALTATNRIGTFGPWSDTGAAIGIQLINGPSLTTAGLIQSTGPIDLLVTDGSLSVNGNLTTGGAVSLAASSDVVSQDAGSVITASSVSGESTGGATLTGANVVGTFGPWSDAGNSSTGLSFTTTLALVTGGDLVSVGDITLTSSAGITLNNNLMAPGNNVTLNASGVVTQNAGAITAAIVTGTSQKGATLNGANLIGTFGGWSDTAGNSSGISVANDQTLTTGGTVSSDSGLISLITVGAGSNLMLGGGLTASGNTVTLNSAGSISQSGGAITANGLLVKAVGSASLPGANAVALLAADLTAGAGGAFTFNNTSTNFASGTIGVVSGIHTSNGAVTLSTTSSGNITLNDSINAGSATVSLNAAGRVDESTGAIIIAQTLNGSSVGGALLNQINAIAAIGTWSNSGSGTGFSFTDGSPLSVGGISTPGPIALTTTSAGSNLTLTGQLNTQNTPTASVTLNSAGTISETTGSVSADNLNGSSVGGANFTGGLFNNVANFGPFQNTGSGDITLRNGINLTVTGAGLSTPGNITLAVDNGDPDLIVSAPMMSGATLSLFANGNITETAAGSLSAPNLIAVTAVDGGGMITLDQAGMNAITGTVTLASLNAQATAVDAGSISFVDTKGFTIAGTAVLTVVPAGIDPALEPGISTKGTVTLSSGGALSETGIIQAPSLTITSVGAVTLPGNNAVGVLVGTVTTASAGFTFNNTANALAVGTGAGGIGTKNGPVTLTTTTSGDIAINQPIVAGTGTVIVAASGNLTIAAAGSVAGGDVTLATLADFTNNAGAGAITAVVGNRWLIYSTNPANDVDTGLSPDFLQYNAPYSISTLTGATPEIAVGNGLLYSTAPTITLTSVTKQYDSTDNLPSAFASYTATGNINGDTVTGVIPAVGSAYTSDNVNPGIQINVTGGAVTAMHSGIPVFGYSLTPLAADSIGTITKAPLTLTAASDTRIYNGTNSSSAVPTVTAGVLFGADTVTNASELFASANVLGPNLSTLNVAGYTLNDGNGGKNYTVTLNPATGTINAAPLTLTAASDTRIYNGTTSSSAVPTVTAGVLFGADTVTNASELFASANVLGPNLSTLNVAGFTLNDGNGGKNYTVMLNPATGTINAAPLSLTAASDTRVYNGTTSSSAVPTVTAGVLFGADTVTNASELFASANVLGPNLSTLNVAGYTLNDGNGGKNYNVMLNPATGTINAAPLTLTAASDTRVYNGTNSSSAVPTVTAGVLFGADTVTNASELFASANVLGPNLSTLNVAGYTLNDGNGGKNYTVMLNSATGTINAAPLTLTAASDTRLYNGTTSSSAVPTVTAGVLFGADTVTNASELFASANVLGPNLSTLNVAGFTLNDGNGGKNYTVMLNSATGTINAAPLSLTAASDTRVYNGTTSSTAVPTVTAGVLFGADTVTNTSELFASANVLGPNLSTLNVAGYTLNDGNGGKNYNVMLNPATGTINAAPLTLTAASDTRIYNGTNSSSAVPTVTAGVLFGADTVTNASELFASANVLGPNLSTLNVAGYTLNDGNGGKNYNVMLNPATGTINAAPLSLTAASDTRIYNGTTSSSAVPTVTAGVLFGADTVTNASELFASANVLGPNLSTLNVAGYTLNDGNGGKNYTVMLNPATGTINAAPLTLTAASDTRIYNGTTSSSAVPTVTAGVLFGADTVTNASELFASANVLGPNLSTLNVAGYTLNDGNGGKNYTVMLNSATGTINAAPLSLTAASDTRVYNGTTSSSAVPTVTAGVLFGADTVTNASELFASANVLGPNLSTLNVAGYTLNDGNGGKNYNVMLNSATGTINAAPLTLTAASDTRLYNGTTSSTAVPTVTAGVLFGADTVTNASELFASANVLGPNLSTLNVAGYTLNDGNGGKNYNVMLNSATGTINAAPLTLTAVSDTRIYNGTNSSSAVPTVTAGVLFGADTVTNTSELFASANVLGPNLSTLNVAGFTLNDGNGGKNYTVMLNPATGTINAAPLTVAIIGNPTKVYDATTTATLGSANYSVTGFVTGESATITQTAGNYANANADVGIGVGATLASSNFTPGGATLLSNYQLPASAAGLGTITQAPLAVAIVGNPTKIYDGTTAATLGAANYSLTGFVAGQGATVTQNAGIYTAANVATGIGLSAGLANADFSANSGTLLANYTLPTKASGSGAITPATLTYTSDPASRTYGAANPAFTGSVGGLVNGETQASATTGSVGFSSPATGSSNVGSYAIIGAGLIAANGNYVFVQAPGNATALTVVPATLTVALTGTVGKTYDGSNAANSLTSANYALAGVVAGDDIALSAPTTGTYGTANMGTGLTVTVSGLAVSGTGIGNYVFASDTASGNIGTITPEALNITANNATRNAGQANPALTYNLTSGTLFDGDALTGNVATSATVNSAAGSYPIAIGNLSASANYQIDFVGGVLTILPTATTTTTTQTAVQSAQPAISALTALAAPDASALSFGSASETTSEVGQVAAPGQKKAATPQDAALASIASFRAAACSASGTSAAPALFVVLPSATGKKIGGVVVNDGSNEEVLDQSFAAAAMSGGEISSCRVSKAEIDTTFRRAVSARPMLPHHFALHLGAGGRLDADSQQLYHDVLADIAQRRAYQIEIIGYSLQGARERALAQAGAVRGLLAHDLINPQKIALTARANLGAIMPNGDHPEAAPDRVVEIWVR